MSLQVYASDAEESVYSGPSRAGDYSSLDLPQPGLDTGAVYRNPRFCRTQGHRVGTSYIQTKGVKKFSQNTISGECAFYRPLLVESIY